MSASIQSSTVTSAPSHEKRNLSPEAIMQLGFGYWASRTLLSAVELALFTGERQGQLLLEDGAPVWRAVDSGLESQLCFQTHASPRTSAAMAAFERISPFSAIQSAIRAMHSLSL
jgi:hypothetical protein